jgi:hypothetical protein
MRLDQDTERHLARTVETLTDEFRDHVAPARVEHEVRETVAWVAADARGLDFIPTLAHRFSRDRLRELSRAS